jgi:hypothetical protein
MLAILLNKISDSKVMEGHEQTVIAFSNEEADFILDALLRRVDATSCQREGNDQGVTVNGVGWSIYVKL